MIQQIDQCNSGSERTLSELFETAYVRKIRDASENTLRVHRITLGKLNRFLARDATLHDLNDATISDFVWWIHRTEDRSARTANRCRDSILAQWRYYARKGIVPLWPDVPALREPERIPVAWTREELQRLFIAISGETGDVHGVPATVWWHSLHAVLWDTGERIGAVRSLDWRWVDLRRRTVVFRAETRKGKRRDRVHDIHEQTAGILRRSWAAQGKPASGVVWPWGRDPLAIYAAYRRLLEKAGLPADRMRKFHCMRRSAASYLEAAGGNATEFLDHADRRITKRSYLDPRITGGTSAATLLFRPESVTEQAGDGVTRVSGAENHE